MHVHVQRLVSVVKMTIVFEESITEEHCSVMRFLWTKGLNAKDIHREIFLVYGGKCLAAKAYHYWVADVSLMTKRLKQRCRIG
jgi:hypothetical protein